MRTSRVKVGVMGCGGIAQLAHLNILARMPSVDLTAIAEPNRQRQERARLMAPGAAVFDDFQCLLEKGEVDAVVIGLPNRLHARAAIASLQRGKHVYLEKPLAMSLEEGENVLAAWRKAGTVGMIGFNYRFNPLCLAMKQQISGGKLGKWVYARSVFSTPIRALPEWKQSRQAGGGALLDLASHHIDLIHFIFNQDIREVSAKINSFQTEDDQAILQFGLSDGLRIHSFFSLGSVEENGFQVYSQVGKLSMDLYLSTDVEVNDATLHHVRLRQLGKGLKAFANIPSLLNRLRYPGYDISYWTALAHFVDAAKSRSRVTPDFDDGYRSLRIVEAAEESAKTGRSFPLPEREMKTLSQTTDPVSG